MAFLLVYSTLGINSGKQVCLDLKMAAILKMPTHWTQPQFDIRYIKIVPNYVTKVFFMAMTSSMTSEGDIKVALYIHV